MSAKFRPGTTSERIHCTMIKLYRLIAYKPSSVTQENGRTTCCPSDFLNLHSLPRVTLIKKMRELQSEPREHGESPWKFIILEHKETPPEEHMIRIESEGRTIE